MNNDLLNEISTFSQYEQNHISDDMVESSYYGDYAEYSKNDYAFIAGEIALWRAVLLQYLIDLKIKSKKKKYNAIKKNAYKWFMDNDNIQNVKKVCNYAGYEYRKVIQLVKEIVDTNYTAINI